ncbi:hypothetical protein BLNAU_3149 [Blattamonas nauphoetae]|uniref:Uncharacterized protein n=1 Tax=Blattamonas nauphoetae TaxID=2049346 RepID=A0ABQ9YD74_9EUKA|nr:hypothetical protein BLNAU_3149 [Blattamonas nauphoetae]
MNWNPKNRRQADSVAPAFHSLVSMVQDGYQFDEELVSRASQFFSSIDSSFRKQDSLDDLLQAIGQDSPNPTAVFLPSYCNTLHTDPQSIRDVVLHEVLIPIEPSLVQITRHRHLL